MNKKSEKKKSKLNNRNPVAKNLKKFNKAKVFIDRKKEEKKHGYRETQKDYEE